VLTAGHCLQGPVAKKALQENDFDAVLLATKEDMLAEKRMQIKESNIFIHPLYRSDSYIHDIGLIKLENPGIDHFTKGDAVSLSTSAKLPESATLVSWGLHKGSWHQTTEIKEQEFRLIREGGVAMQLARTCRTELLQGDQEICCYNVLSNLQPGDSGGPLLIRIRSTNNWIQVGIAVRGTPIGRKPCKTVET
jgi:agmatine/peptidylarginine deiminase